MNYFTYPYPSGKHLVMSTHYIDFENRQAILVENGDQPVTFTLVQDLAAIVAEALDYPGEWPAVGGVEGWQTTSADLVKLGEKIRGPYLSLSPFPGLLLVETTELTGAGGTFTIHSVSRAGLEAGGLQTSWVPLMEHPAIPKGREVEFSRMATGEAMKGIPRGAWAVSDEWNKLLPGFKFTDPERFLRESWEGKA